MRNEDWQILAWSPSVIHRILANGAVIWGLVCNMGLLRAFGKNGDWLRVFEVPVPIFSERSKIFFTPSQFLPTNRLSASLDQAGGMGRRTFSPA